MLHTRVASRELVPRVISLQGALAVDLNWVAPVDQKLFAVK